MRDAHAVVSVPAATGATLEVASMVPQGSRRDAGGISLAILVAHARGSVRRSRHEETVLQQPARTRPTAVVRTLAGCSRFRPRIARIAVAASLWALAASADFLTGQRWSAIWGSGAILGSAAVLIPAMRRVMPRMLAYAGVWLLFLTARAVADDLLWTDTTLHLVGEAERSIFGGSPGEKLQSVAGDGAMGRGVDWATAIVYLSYFVVPHILAIWLAVCRPASFHVFVRSLAVLFAVGVIVFALLPAAPPWHASGGGTTRVVPALLGEPALDFDPNPVASMPSLHLAVTALLVPAAQGAGWQKLAVAYVVAMGFSLVYLGEHHLLDVLAGAVAAGLAWRLARGLTAPKRLFRMERRADRKRRLRWIEA